MLNRPFKRIYTFECYKLPQSKLQPRVDRSMLTDFIKLFPKTIRTCLTSQSVKTDSSKPDHLKTT